tara:strand:- start:287 stop:505 length:219 start_codon:yes stop_codon:yes gene_type:complete
MFGGFSERSKREVGGIIGYHRSRGINYSSRRNRFFEAANTYFELRRVGEAVRNIDVKGVYSPSFTEDVPLLR